MRVLRSRSTGTLPSLMGKAFRRFQPPWRFPSSPFAGDTPANVPNPVAGGGSVIITATAGGIKNDQIGDHDQQQHHDHHRHAGHAHGSEPNERP